jgi:hypothetical protein
VHLINNTAKYGGTIIYVRNTTIIVTINVGYKVKMNFFDIYIQNQNSFLGVTVSLDNSSITTATNVRLHFDSNYAVQDHPGGALCLQHQNEINLNPQTEIIFTSFFAAALLQVG